MKAAGQRRDIAAGQWRYDRHLVLVDLGVAEVGVRQRLLIVSPAGLPRLEGLDLVDLAALAAIGMTAPPGGGSAGGGPPRCVA